eukprot:1156504-Pelagomonas_calceolata.AAC.1
MITLWCTCDQAAVTLCYEKESEIKAVQWLPFFRCCCRDTPPSMTCASFQRPQIPSSSPCPQTDRQTGAGGYAPFEQDAQHCMCILSAYPEEGALSFAAHVFTVHKSCFPWPRKPSEMASDWHSGLRQFAAGSMTSAEHIKTVHCAWRRKIAETARDLHSDSTPFAAVSSAASGTYQIYKRIREGNPPCFVIFHES